MPALFFKFPTKTMSSIQVSEKSGVRYLHFSADWIQGAMRIQRPNALELSYTRDMMACLLLHEPPWPRNVLLIGLGAGSLVKFIYHQLPETQITVIEIDPQVEIIARLYFKLPDDPKRINIVIDDGADYMRRDGKKFDAIFVDGFDKDGRAGILDTLPFYQACRSRLTDEGVMSVNLLGRSRGFEASAERIDKAFEGRSLLFPSCDSGNTIAFGAGSDPVDVPHDELITRAKRIKEATSLNLLQTIPRLQATDKLIHDRLVI